MSAMGHSMRFGDIRPTNEREGMPSRELRIRRQQGSAQCVLRQMREQPQRSLAVTARYRNTTRDSTARTGTRRRGSRSGAGTRQRSSSGTGRTCLRPPLSCVTQAPWQHNVSQATWNSASQHGTAQTCQQTRYKWIHCVLFLEAADANARQRFERVEGVIERAERVVLTHTTKDTTANTSL